MIHEVAPSETKDESAAELERLRAEIAAIRSSILLLLDNTLPHRYDDTTRTDNIENHYAIPIPRTSLREALEVIPVYNGRNMTLT